MRSPHDLSYSSLHYHWTLVSRLFLCRILVTMASSWSSCPNCLHNTEQSGLPGTSCFKHSIPSWTAEFVCSQCGQQPWFECFHDNCNLPAHKNLFHNLKQLRHHAQHWHRLTKAPTVKCTIDALVNSDYHGAPDGDDLLDFAQPDKTAELECSPSTPMYLLLFALPNMALHNLQNGP